MGRGDALILGNGVRLARRCGPTTSPSSCARLGWAFASPTGRQEKRPPLEASGQGVTLPLVPPAGVQ